jgi:fluoride exporter
MMTGMHISMGKMLIVGLGGFLGAALRYAISGATAKTLGHFPLGTLIVNIAGGLLMGIIMELSDSVCPIPDNVRIFLTTGILGGLTTFSTFSYETVSYMSGGEYLMGGLNAGLNLVLALGACWVGKIAVQMLSQKALA